MKHLFLPLFFLFAATFAASAAPADPGIYAIFQTNRGEFTARLYHEQTPTTVANFVGLAEGSRPFIDPAQGLVQRPFYNGITFHRVIKNFMIQGGSPNGQGTDGPGYQFVNEFSTALRHDRPGILSMANAGPDTNGSQFFITVAPTPHLDYKHSIFGEIVEGMDVVLAISQTETGPGDRPIDPVIIETVQILRNGTAAQEFDVHAHRLPKLTALTPTLSASPQLSLHFPRQIYRQEILFSSSDLQTWTRHPIPFHYTQPAAQHLDISAIAAGKPQQFYRLAAIDYHYVAPKLAGKRLKLSAQSEPLEIVLNIVSDPTENPTSSVFGNGTLNGGELRNLNYVYYQDPVSGTLYFILSGIVQINAHLHFETETSGRFSGIADPAYSGWGIFGTFTLENL